MKSSAFDWGSRLFIMGLLAMTVWVTIFDGKIDTLKSNIAVRVPGLATSISVLLPTAQVRATQVIGTTLTLRTPLPIVVVAPPGSSSGPAILPDCSTVATTSPCQWISTTPTPMPPLVTPRQYEGCGDEFYSCEDLTAIALVPVQTTDAFLATPVATDPEVQRVQSEWTAACLASAGDKTKRGMFLGPICDEAGL